MEFNPRVERNSNLNKLQTFIFDRDTLQNIKIRGDNVFNRIKWPSVSLNFFSKCWKRPPPDTSDVKDVEQGQRWRFEWNKYVLFLHLGSICLHFKVVNNTIYEKIFSISINFKKKFILRCNKHCCLQRHKVKANIRRLPGNVVHEEWSILRATLSSKCIV